MPLVAYHLLMVYLFSEVSQAFELAKQNEGCIFVKQEDMDIDKIMESKYFRSLLPKSEAKSTKTKV